MKALTLHKFDNQLDKQINEEPFNEKTTLEIYFHRKFGTNKQLQRSTSKIFVNLDSL